MPYGTQLLPNMSISLQTPVYDRAFWQKRRSAAELSASLCVPLLNKILMPFSVVDVGCGHGHWLVEFERLGVDDCLGIDGEYVLAEGQLLISPAKFLAHDLAQSLPCDRQFSLALCLEVGEHMSPACAAPLVRELTRLAP